MSTEHNNRVEAEVMRWRQREERFRNTFSAEMSSNKGLRRKQLEEYNRIAVKYRNTKDPDERIALAVLKHERKHIEKQAYTNRFIRTFRKVFVNPIKRYFLAREQKRLEQSNQRNIWLQLQQMGMSEHYAKVVKKMKTGELEFSVPVSHQINEKERMDHMLSFKQKNSGEYVLDSNQVGLNNEADSKMNRQQIFRLDEGTAVNAEESYNLLNGRAVQKDGKWIKLDLNDKDTKGNYQIREFNQSYGYDVEKSLEGLNIKEMKNQTERDKLVADLKRGKRCQVVIGNRKYEVEANPQFRTVNIYDENSQRVSNAEVQGKRTMKEHLAQDDFKPKVAKRNGVRVA